MRTLNKKQKNLLDDWFSHNSDQLTIFFDLAKSDLFDYDLYEKLREINDFETINDHINGYITDKL